ncbi:MAG: hypothetical protein IPJ03_15255 [Ignavibacteriales bacterium]|nr:hypothetical protein [Ignavibacteriales bacterium]
MYQEIVICPDVFKKIREFYIEQNDSIDIKTYKENLKLKKIVLDSGKTSYLFDAIKCEIEKADYQGKNSCKLILEEFTKSNRIKFDEIKNEGKITTDKVVNRAINLSLRTESKILHSENNQLKCYQYNYSGFEVINTNEMVKPPVESCLLNFSRDLELKDGQVIDIFHLLRYYFKDTIKLVIEDKYLRGRKNQFNNLKKLLSECNNLKILEIYSNLEDRNEANEKNNYTEQEFLSQLNKMTKAEINLQQANRKMHDRIYTGDRFKIKFSSGLDFIDHRNVVYKDEVTINIRPKNE